MSLMSTHINLGVDIKDGLKRVSFVNEPMYCTASKFQLIYEVSCNAPSLFRIPDVN